MMPEQEVPRCPVCKARFRGQPSCSRCGADLKPLMALIAKAWNAREEARRALKEGDYLTALGRALIAQEAQASPAGASLVRIARILRSLQSANR